LHSDPRVGRNSLLPSSSKVDIGGKNVLNIYSENLKEGNNFAGLDLNWRVRILYNWNMRLFTGSEEIRMKYRVWDWKYSEDIS